MPEKMAFCERLHVALLISQSLSPAVHQLYRNRLGCLVTGIPNTGLDSALFHPTTPVEHRPVDLGYRAGDGPFYLGHQERRTIGEFFTDHAARYGLEVDISLRVQDRLPEDAWAAFLNRCKGQLGCEAGGDFFDLNDAVRRRTLAYEASHPGASFDEVFDHCLRDEPDTIPLRILSGRHIEAAGTGTAQLLFEGHYDGCLVADEHYIPLKKDFSNAADAVAKFRDTGFRQRIVANALHLARDQFTYERLLDRFQAALAPVL